MDFLKDTKAEIEKLRACIYEPGAKAREEAWPHALNILNEKIQ